MDARMILADGWVRDRDHRGRRTGKNLKIAKAIAKWGEALQLQAKRQREQRIWEVLRVDLSMNLFALTETLRAWI